MGNQQILKYMEYISDPFYIAEIIAIISTIIMAYLASLSLYSGHIPSQPVLLVPQLLFIFYGSVLSFNFAQKLERGVIGSIFSFPIHRINFLRTMSFFEIFFLPFMITLSYIFIEGLTIFSLDPAIIIFTFIFMLVTILFMISIGKTLAVLFKNSMLSFIIFFIVFYSMDYLSSYFVKIIPVWIVTAGFGALVNLQINLTYEMTLMVIFLVSVSLLEASYRILLNSNLKNGR